MSRRNRAQELVDSGALSHVKAPQIPLPPAAPTPPQRPPEDTSLRGRMRKHRVLVLPIFSTIVDFELELLDRLEVLEARVHDLESRG